MSTNTQWHVWHVWGQVRRDFPTAAANQKSVPKGKWKGKGLAKGGGKDCEAGSNGEKGGDGEARTCYTCQQPETIAATCNKPCSASGVDHDAGEGM